MTIHSTKEHSPFGYGKVFREQIQINVQKDIEPFAQTVEYEADNGEKQERRMVRDTKREYTS